MRVMVFNPVPLQDFYTNYISKLKDDLYRNMQRDFWNYNICFEIVETMHNNTNQPMLLPVLSRFVRLEDISDFIIDNNMLSAAREHYGVRIVATHILADCFLYMVINEEIFLDKNKIRKGTSFSQIPKDKIRTGNVTLKPLSYFSCGKSLLAATNKSEMHPLETHVPIKLQENTPRQMTHLSQKCLLFWLPSMQRIQSNDLVQLIHNAYNFYEDNIDLLYNTEEGVKDS